MEHTLRILEQRVPPPQRVSFKGSFVYRYAEKSLPQALVQKLARLVSGLHAARLLMEHGFVQEQAALQRMLDDIEEDITFLTYSVIFNKPTPLHQKYLDTFYQEEFDAKTGKASTQKRPMISREKIRAYIARMDRNPSRAIDVSRIINKAYSGYVHAVSPHIMDMYGGNPPYFHTRGMADTRPHRAHRKDLWNYFYRSLIAFVSSAMAFGDVELFELLNDFSHEFARQSGEDELLPPRNEDKD
jgi:hypothetical protein